MTGFIKTYAEPGAQLQNTFDAAVVIPTILRPRARGTVGALALASRAPSRAPSPCTVTVAPCPWHCSARSHWPAVPVALSARSHWPAVHPAVHPARAP